MKQPQQRYSGWSLVKAARARSSYWHRLWGGTPLQEAYDVVVVGAGGHGLATAYHLAHAGWTDTALIERAELSDPVALWPSS